MVPSETGFSRTAAFEISEDQYDLVLETVQALRANPGDRVVVGSLIDLVLDLTDTGLSYFFLHPLELAGVGSLRRKGVEVAIGTAGRVLPSVVRSTVGSMSEDQLMKVADFMERMVGGPLRDR
jgi:hypothetical protein